MQARHHTYTPHIANKPTEDSRTPTIIGHLRCRSPNGG